MSMVDFIRKNPVGNDMTMEQAIKETCGVLPLVPPQTANLMMTNIAISQIGKCDYSIGGINSLF